MYNKFYVVDHCYLGNNRFMTTIPWAHRLLPTAVQHQFFTGFTVSTYTGGSPSAMEFQEIHRLFSSPCEFVLRFSHSRICCLICCPHVCGINSTSTCISVGNPKTNYYAFNPKYFHGLGMSNASGTISNYTNITCLRVRRSCVVQGFAKSRLVCLVTAPVGRSV